MEAYINSLSCISHYNTIDENFFFEDVPVLSASRFLSVTAPDYKNYIPANTIRRTSHILKMGISAGLICLKKTGREGTDAIIVGSAMGCYEDTDKFLRSIDENNERMLTPTSFIQSTHNTVGGQLALLVKCHGYNFTYVHQNLSFEYALLDAMLLLKEKEANHVLVGALDELNPALCELFDRAGHIKQEADLQQPIWKSTSKGYIAGEGACFFDLSDEKTEQSIAKLRNVKMMQRCDSVADLTENIYSFLENLNLKIEDMDVVLSGISGDVATDILLHEVTDKLNLPTGYFKHLCGEYFTASGFALWLAASMIQRQTIPGVIFPGTKPPLKLKNILILNQYENHSYSLICVSAC